MADIISIPTAILERYLDRGAILGTAPYGCGHINQTFKVDVMGADDMGEKATSLIVQKVNTGVFTRPLDVMANIAMVTSYVERSILTRGSADEVGLRLFWTRDNQYFVDSPEHGFWRAYYFVPDTVVYEHLPEGKLGHHLAFEVARAYGRFQFHLDGLDVGRVSESIPGFHDTPCRLEQFESALKKSSRDRRNTATTEIAFTQSHSHLAPILTDLLSTGVVPRRVVHNDTKLSNALFAEMDGSMRAIGVTDLDTIMPGTLLYDFGDMVRAAISPSAEDEADLSRVVVDMEIFEALVAGYIKGAGGVITSEEVKHFGQGALVIIFEQAVRFLTDHLLGDKYYRVDENRTYHNLDRARTQIAILSQLEDNWSKVEQVIARHS